MPRGHYTIRRASKKYRCTEKSWHTIKAGDRYLSAACPPEHEANGGRSWWIIRACLQCADDYLMHTSDTRKQLEELNDARITVPTGRARCGRVDSVPLCHLPPPESESVLLRVSDVHSAG